MIVYILKHFDIYINKCWKWNRGWVYKGAKSPVSVSDKKVYANQGRFYFYFYHLYLFLSTKNSLFVSDIQYLWKGIEFEGVILLKFTFLEEIICLKNNKVDFWGNESGLAILTFDLKIFHKCCSYDALFKFKKKNTLWKKKNVLYVLSCISMQTIAYFKNRLSHTEKKISFKYFIISAIQHI